jgi:hypothetical protein
MLFIKLRMAEDSPPIGSGAGSALMAAPWAVTSVAHRDGFSVLGSQRGSRLRRHNDMETPVMLALIGGR